MRQNQFVNTLLFFFLHSGLLFHSWHIVRECIEKVDKWASDSKLRRRTDMTFQNQTVWPKTRQVTSLKRRDVHFFSARAAANGANYIKTFRSSKYAGIMWSYLKTGWIRSSCGGAGTLEKLLAATTKKHQNTQSGSSRLVPSQSEDVLILAPSKSPLFMWCQSWCLFELWKRWEGLGLCNGLRLTLSGF